MTSLRCGNPSFQKRVRRCSTRGRKLSHFKDEPGNIFLGDFSTTFIADEAGTIHFHHLAQAAAALGIEVAVRDEGERHGHIVAPFLEDGLGSAV